MARVLIVEDDDSMAVALKDGFTFEGYETNLARDGEEPIGLHGAGRGNLRLELVEVDRTPQLNVLALRHERARTFGPA